MERLLQQAAESYQTQQFGAALDALEAAYALRSSAAVLYNIAQACREAGAEKEALALYEQSASQTPNPALRNEARQRALALRRKLAYAEERRGLSEQQQTLATQQRLILENQRVLAEQQQRLDAQRALLPPPGPAAAEKPPLHKRWWFWTALGGAVVASAVIGGAVAYAVPRSTTAMSTSMYPNLQMANP